MVVMGVPLILVGLNIIPMITSYIGYFSLCLIFGLFQTVRIFRRKIVYRNWINFEIPSIKITYVILLVIPGFFFSISDNPLFFFIIMIVAIVSLIILLIRIISYRNSFINYNITVKDIVKKLEKEGIEFKKSKIKDNLFFLIRRKDKQIHLPEFSCKIIKTKKGIIVEANNRKAKNNVYKIIDSVAPNNDTYKN